VGEGRARGSREATPFVKNKPSPLLAAYAGKCLLVTGAGGFIGSALTLALAAGSPRFLVLLDNSEHNLHEIDLALREQCSVAHEVAHTAILGDICDVALLAEVLERYRPEIIFHAAACKHVPLMEKNPLAAIRANALGTWRLLRAAETFRASQVLLISTDKAVEPASVMGATKRVAELVLARMGHRGMTLQTVRLGNVLGSHGSVAPLFARQIARGGPVTVTHPEIERYFFTLEETVEIILIAAALESGTFIPEPVPPLRIAELAERMIREAHDACGAVSIEFTGMRPGDKLREEFLNEGEFTEAVSDGLDHRRYQRLLRVRGPQIHAQRLAVREFAKLMLQLEEALELRQLGQAMEVLRKLVPEYHPSELLLEMLQQASVAKA
jgi:FlaA1/EpsC-like NDP-sugar epimerase